MAARLIITNVDLAEVLINIGQIPPREDLFNEDERVQALVDSGVETLEDFLLLSAKDFESLIVPGDPVAGTDDYPLSLFHRRYLVALSAYVHDESRKLNRLAMPDELSAADFNDYRVGRLRHSNPIVPYGIPVQTPGDTEVAAWRKTLKLDRKDFPVFKEDMQFMKLKDRYESRFRATGMEDMIRPPDFVPDNKELDESKRQWTYDMLETQLQTPTAVMVVREFEDTKDVRGLWARLQEEYSNNQLAEIQLNGLSTFLTGKRFCDTRWTGTQQSQLTHWNEQMRHYDKYSSDPFTDTQKVRMLHQACIGTSNLELVRTQYMVARQGAQNKDPVSYAEFFSMLIQASQVYDASHTNRRTGPRRQMNSHVFESQESDDERNLEIQEHDINTPISDLMTDSSQDNQWEMNYTGQQGIRPMNRNKPTSREPRKVMMDKKTWQSLGKEDQQAWDKVTQPGKTKILNVCSESCQEIYGHFS